MDAVLAFWIASMASVCTNVKIHESRTNKEGTLPVARGDFFLKDGHHQDIAPLHPGVPLQTVASGIGI
jgi:hypothetical protein